MVDEKREAFVMAEIEAFLENLNKWTEDSRVFKYDDSTERKPRVRITVSDEQERDIFKYDDSLFKYDDSIYCTERKPRVRITVSDEQKREAKEARENLLLLLKSLPCPNVSEEPAVMEKISILYPRFTNTLDTFEQNEAINNLLNPTSILRSYSDATLQDNLLSTLYYMSIHESNKSMIVKGCTEAIPFLVASLKSQTCKIKCNAADVLSHLSTLDSNKRAIGESGAVEPLISLIKEGRQWGLRCATTTLLNVCTLVENREEVVSAGAVIAVIDKILSRRRLDEMLRILVLLSSHERAMTEMEENTVLVPFLFKIMKEEVEEKIKEQCTVLLHDLYYTDITKMKEKIKDVGEAREALERVASTGTSAAKVKANDLVRELAELDSGFSREIGKVGAATSLIHNIGEDQVGKPITAMLELCLELENREFAVSNGVTTAVMKMVVSLAHVKETLQTLKMLSKHEEAIAEMEKFGILKYLFEILGEDVGDQAKGYCVDIIHAMCHASSAINTRMQIKDVENAHQKLERLVNTKLNQVLLKLQEWANEELP